MNGADITNLRQLLQYLTLVWHSGAQVDDTFGQMVEPFFLGLVNWLSGDTSSHGDLTHLRSSCALVLATSPRSLGGLSGTSVAVNDVWETVLAEADEPIDLVLAGENCLPCPNASP